MIAPHAGGAFARWTLLFYLLAAAPALAQEGGPIAPEADGSPGGDAIDRDDAPAPRDPAKGLVRGRVTSKATGDALIEARVSAQGTPFSTLTDVEGQYSLELPPGRHELRVWYELHQPLRVQDVVVEAGAEQQLDVRLVGDEDAVVEIVVETDADRSRASVQLEKRRRAASVIDAVSAEEMSKTPDSSAADAVKRAVGATVVDGRYLVVRGLGGRYTTTLLEGVPVPSPEPDLQAVPLDLFPASLLASIAVVKTASPDLPANFGGGAMLLDARQFPTEFELKLKGSFSGDSIATARNGPRYVGGSTDFLGFDDGTRSLPARLPSSSPAGRGNLSRAEREAIGESFGRTWGTKDEGLPPNLGLGASVGDTVSALGNRLGYLASVSWGQSWDLERTETARTRVDGSTYDEAVEVASLRKVKLGGLGSVAYRLGAADELSFLTLFSRSADDRAQRVVGSDSNDADYERTQLAYIARQLSFHQLRGHHRVAGLGGLELDWQTNYAIVQRDEPSTRSITYGLNPDGSKELIANRGADLLASTLEDHTAGGGLDLGLPLGPVKPKIGVFYTRSSRDYQARRFSFNASRASQETRMRPPDELFTDETIGQELEFYETTQEADAYSGVLQVLATYAMLDVTLLEPLRLSFGARYEKGTTDLEIGSDFKTVDFGLSREVQRTEEDVLPSVNAVLALTPQLNLRGAYGMTVSRPAFREISPTQQYDFVKRRYFEGNPELVRGLIHNADLRLEFFPGATEVLAASVFGKVFEDPIEQVVTSGGGAVQPRNGQGAHVYGLELEARVGLEHLAPALREFGITGNLTLAESRVELREGETGTTTNARRPLQGQSPYSFNFGVLYEDGESGRTAQLLYNVFGRRLDAVGYDGLEDVYERPFHRLDLAFSQDLGSGLSAQLAATNLLDQEEVFAVGETEVSRFSPGTAASVSLAWSI